MLKLNVNSDAVVAFTNKLEKLHKSAFPVAVRKALNDAAFDVKKNTLLKTSKASFVGREKNFFKANSKVEPAKGFDLNSMKATVGMVSTSLKGKSNFAVKDLEQQEHGGTIKGKSFIAKDEARTSGSYEKRVKPIYRMMNLKNIVNAVKVNVVNKKQKFIRAAIMAEKLHGKNAFVLGNMWKDRQTLSRIDEIQFSSRHGTMPLLIKRTPIYTFKKGRHLNVKGRRFAQRAAHESGLRIESYFIKEAQNQFKRLMK